MIALGWSPQFTLTHSLLIISNLLARNDSERTGCTLPCLPSNFCWVAQYFCSSSKYFLNINSLFVPITDMELILDRRRGDSLYLMLVLVLVDHRKDRDLNAWCVPRYRQQETDSSPQTCCSPPATTNTGLSLAVPPPHCPPIGRPAPTITGL